MYKVNNKDCNFVGNLGCNHKNYNFLEFDWSINLCILY